VSHARGTVIGLGLAALALALFAQTALDLRLAPTGWFIGTLAFALSAIAWVGGLGSTQLVCEFIVSPWRHTAPLRDRWLLIGINLAALAFFTLGSNRFTILGTLAWLAAIVSVVWMATPPMGTSERRIASLIHPAAIQSSTVKQISVVLALTLLAAFFRFFRLHTLPAEMGLDPPYIYLGSQAILDGDRPIFVTLFPGQESGFFYLVAAMSRLLGLSFFTLKAASALIGTLTVPALYLLGRRLVNGTVAVVAAILLAANRWHVLMSRTGLRPVLMPLLVVALLWALARALRGGQRRDFAYAGLVLGIGAFTYTGALFLPLLVGLALALYGTLLIHLDLKRIAGRVGLSLLVLVIVITPLLRYAMTPDNAYLTRFQRRVTGQDALGVAPTTRALENATRTVGAFNWQGDNVYAFNLPQKRQLGWISGSLFVLGLVYALSQIRRGPYLLLVLALFATLLPTFITFSHPQEVPNAGRLIGAVVPVCLLAALPIGLLYGAVRTTSPKSLATASIALIIAFLGIEIIESAHDVFSRFQEVQPHHNMAVSAEIANLIDEFTERQSGAVYVVYRPDAHRGFDFQAVDILSQTVEHGWAGFVPSTQLSDLIPAAGTGPTMFILHPEDATSVPMLARAFPAGTIGEVYDPAGAVGLRTFTLNKVP
jgi:4-amino-4-deoxy-L-arabinose transferase-like glycosyltransferase